MLALYLVGGAMMVAYPAGAAPVMARFRDRWLLFGRRSRWEPSPGQPRRMLHVIMYPERFADRPQLQRVAGLYYLATAVIGGSIVTVGFTGIFS